MSDVFLGILALQDSGGNPRITEIREELIAPLADQNTLVFAADEVLIDQEAVVRKAWYEKNTKNELKVDRQKTSQPFIGFLIQNTGDCRVVAVGVAE